MKILNIFWIVYLLLQSPVFGTVDVLNRSDNSKDKIKTLEGVHSAFISCYDFARILSLRVYANQTQEKLVLYLGDHRIKISAETSFIVIDDKIYQMPLIAKKSGSDIYVPADAFFQILKMTAMPGITYDSRKEFLDIDEANFNILGITVDEKANGTILRIETRQHFENGDISTFINDNGWFYITINGGIIDTTELKKTSLRGVAQTLQSDQLGESAQIAVQLRSKVEGHEFYQSSAPRAIIVTLRTPLSKSIARIKDVKNRWRMDTIILDAGHGGKDGGTVGRYGSKEKDIVLDIAMRVGRIIEKKTRIKVIYTRDEDVFVPLDERTKIANKNNGKIFISIHANSSKNKNVRGFETYLLRPGKTDDAIDVASRENAVIKLEGSGKKKYKKLTGENLIMATMAQSMFMKESEDLAAVIQEKLEKNVSSHNRGVKQAGFYVLVGASMPNVLVEVGFLSNTTEEKNLKSATHRQKIAQAIYEGIVQFKNSRERLLAEG